MTELLSTERKISTLTKIMNIAVTGASGFLGRYVVRELLSAGHQVQAWYRGDREPALQPVRWIPGELNDQPATTRLLAGADAVVHAALFRDVPNFMADPADPIRYFETNVIGTLRLLHAAEAAGIRRLVFVSSGTVHQRVLGGGRPLDETHPLWPESLYGSSKAAIETMIHAFGWSGKVDACTLRPTAIYGVDDPLAQSKWYDLIAAVASGRTVSATGGSKEVHAADVARGIRLLLETTESVAGESFLCSDRMISHYEVAQIAQRLSGSRAVIEGPAKQAFNTIDTSKIERLGMCFGGTPLLEQTIREILQQLPAAHES